MPDEKNLYNYSMLMSDKAFAWGLSASYGESIYEVLHGTRCSTEYL